MYGDEGQDLKQSGAYIALVVVIHDTLVNEVDFQEKNRISFSAKDDLWDMEWTERTGLPLTSYNEKWGNLRLLKKGATTNDSQAGSVRFCDIVGLSTPEVEFRTIRLASQYMNSNPGDTSAPKNHAVHSRCRSLFKGDKLSDEALENLSSALRYRLQTIMSTATEYKDRLGLDFPDCQDCDITNY